MGSAAVTITPDAPPSTPVTITPDVAQPSAASRLGSSFLSGAGVVSEQQGKDFFVHPVDTLRAMAETQGELGERAGKELSNGDYVRGLTHGVEWLMPGLGPVLAKSGDQLERKDYAGGIGTTLGAAANIIAAHGMPAATEAVSDAASAIPSKVSSAIDMAKQVTPKQAAQATGAVTGAGLGHGTLSIPGAYYGAKGAGGLAEGILGKERANAPIITPKPVPDTGTPLGPEAPTPELVQSQGLAEGSKPAPEPAKALMDLPVHAVNQAVQELGANAPIPSLTARANQIANLAVEGAGGKIPPPLQPNVPIKNQGGIITPTSESAAAFAQRYPNEAMTSGMSPDVERLWQEGAGFKTEPVADIGSKVRAQMPAVPRNGGLPEGHTAVDSSAVKSYKYDPEAKELDLTTPNGGRYVYGDVSAEQADAFGKGQFKGQKPKDAPSVGKAWNDLRNSGSPLVKKGVNGKLVDVKLAISPEDQISEEEWQHGHELSTAVEGSPK
jgi:KTSC domain